MPYLRRVTCAFRSMQPGHEVRMADERQRLGRWLRVRSGVLLCAALLVVPPRGAASAGPPVGSGAAAPTGLPADAELPPLPLLPPIKPEPVDPEGQKELARVLEKLASEKSDIRAAAQKDLESADAKMVGAIRARIAELHESMDRGKAQRVLEAARKEARDARKEKKKDEAESDDWLVFVLAKPAPKDAAWRDLVQLLGMVRMLGTIGTTPAVRELVQLRARFGDMLRLDLSRQIAKLKDKAVPALLEAKRHDAVVVQRFAELELDRLGRAIPGEAVGTTDPQVLSDVLRAFGYLRDVDAVGVCLSFANHERKKVREAARQAIAGIGEPARWQLRDTYQDLTGEKPDKSVPWDVLARRIFALYDRARLTELTDLASAGMTAARAGKHAEAVQSFDKVLARDPLFDRRGEMVESYYAVALSVPHDRADERLAMLRKAKRLDQASPLADKIEAEISFTEAKALLSEGRPDRFLLQRALELDPQHAEARELLAGFEEAAVAERPTWPRRTVAAGIAAATAGILGLLAALALYRRRGPSPAEKPS